MRAKIIYMTLVVFAFMGCDKACKKVTEDVFTIQNTTGRDITVSLCTNQTYGEVTKNLSLDPTIVQLSLGTREEHVIEGTFFQNCSDSNNGKQNIGVSLSPASFSQFKLCADALAYRHVIVETFQSCPSDYVEQISTGPCN